jgi:hypothetical protein
VRSSLASTPSRKSSRIVAPPFGDELLSAIARQVPPLAHEDRRDVELVRDDGEVRAQSEPDAIGRGQIARHRVERRVERGRALARDVPEQVFLRLDVVVERGLLHAQTLREVGQRRALVAALREEPRGDAG